MRMKDLIEEQLETLWQFNYSPEKIEEFISQPIDYTEHIPPAVCAHVHGYLEGCADAVNMTVLEMLDELGIDLQEFQEGHRGSRSVKAAQERLLNRGRRRRLPR